MISHINNLIKSTKKQYADNYSYMLRDYNQENETVKGYNGRQLLELLQNCDDEGSKEVLIKLDTKKRQVSIHNIGTPFSEKGYRSLFISNLSSKTEQKKYIGNKGLGFRSIINWSKGIEIQSNNISLSYSEKKRKANFQELFDTEIQQQIRTEQNLKDHVIPLPFLTIPDISVIEQKEYVTSIIIEYKISFLKDIIKQIRAITPETILFLNNIQNIKFEGLEGKENISCKREVITRSEDIFEPKTKISFENGTIWQIFEKEKVLPEKYWDKIKQDEEFYQIKIAIEENFEYSSPFLYSFFPTRIQLKQPYILHATFDLDATRNQINDSEKNRFILKKIVKFTTKVAKYFSRDEVSYKPLEILHHINKADTLAELGYYDLIDSAIHIESILPCIDNTYKTLEESIFISNVFGQMLLNIGAENEINCHLLPLENKNLRDYNLEGHIDNDLVVLKDVIEIINRISAKELSMINRAQFIYQIVENCDFIKEDYENSMTFLVNDQLMNIQIGEYIYTPITKKNELKTPSFANIQFLNKALYDELLEMFEFNVDENSNKSRFIYDQLKGFCNIHSYEPATLAQKIISESRNRLNTSPENKVDIIKEMNQCLFHNFQKLNDETKLPEAIRVPGITKKGNIKLVDELVFSDEYPIGKITETIFKGIYKPNDFIGAPDILGLDVQDKNKVQDYLKWIGVNDFAIYKSITTQDENLQKYRVYLTNVLNEHIDSRIKARVWSIKNLEIILKLISIEKFILWIHFDEKLRKQLNDLENVDSLQYFYRTWNSVYVKPSYIKYQIDQLSNYILSDYLIDERYSWINNFSFDYRKDFFKEHGISKSSIDAILLILGAKDDFSNLSIDKVLETINKLPERYPNGKKTQIIYKMALANYKENGNSLNSEVFLFADDGKELKPFPQSEVYFSDNIKLPKQLMKDFPVLNFPARSGGAEAIDFFGINDLSAIKIELISSKLVPELNSKFNEFLELLKPTILTYRINAIEENRLHKIQASICKKITFVLCSQIEYSIGDASYEVLDYEFIHNKDQTYYVKVNEYDTIHNLKSNRTFINSCADIVSLSFDVRGDRNEFRHLFSNEFEDTLTNIKVDFGEDTFNEARELLGLADYKQAFWQAIFVSKGIKFLKHMDDLTLEAYIKSHFNLDVNVNVLDYEKINDEDEMNKIQNLFDTINLELESFSTHYPYNISLEEIHFSMIKNVLLSKKTIIKSAIWKKLKSKPIIDQSEYLNEINKFEDFYDFVREIAEKNKYNFNIDLDLIFIEYVNQLYYEVDIKDEVDVSDIRDKNSEMFTEEELYKVNQSKRLKSLLFFENAINTIKSEIIEQVQALGDDATTQNNLNYEETKIISSEKLKEKERNGKGNKRGKRVFIPKDSDDRKLKEIGNTAEEYVFNHLKKNNFNNVDWVSKDNENLQCDIRFTDEQGVLKYIEVKSFDSGRFYLSSSEFEFGKSEIDNYEIWLVRNKNEIIKIQDFFTNSKYNPITSEYEVNLEVE
ncbi:DUF3883 domain-containing protein [Polaribacter litorisediminis]|uniref:DUF3883 domain-containing protein n=1 Tax=Polaribacter litorisediminis TaxID=1908341 RepID=UPI001CBAFBED|nr:DUF3883 domain-containing protein [Polaribacter litorisediminis]UAM98014.1 DUF3883 domain-containing protein [Polaribacter litorisediminis]